MIKENKLLLEIADALDLTKDELIYELELLDIQDIKPDNLLEQLYEKGKIDFIIRKYNRVNALVWECTNCGSLLNSQDGFKKNKGIWFCKDCGVKNNINIDRWKNVNKQ